MRIPKAAYCAMEYYRWAFRSRARQDGRRFNSAMRRPIRVPVLQLHGQDDPYMPVARARGSGRWVSGRYEWQQFPGGHFLAEENPEAVSNALLSWLSRLPEIA